MDKEVRPHQDRNLLRSDSQEILKMNVEMTIVDGKIVFERGK